MIVTLESANQVLFFFFFFFFFKNISSEPWTVSSILMRARCNHVQHIRRLSHVDMSCATWCYLLVLHTPTHTHTHTQTHTHAHKHIHTHTHTHTYWQNLIQVELKYFCRVTLHFWMAMALKSGHKEGKRWWTFQITVYNVSSIIIAVKWIIRFQCLCKSILLVKFTSLILMWCLVFECCSFDMDVQLLVVVC